MNPTSNKIGVRTLRRSLNRYLCAQQNVNKSTSAYHTVNLLKKIENRSCFFTSNKLLHEPLDRSKALLFTNVIRNESSWSNIFRMDLDKIDTPPEDDLSSIPESEKDGLDALLENIAGSNFVEQAQNFLQLVHEATGLPWWATIALTAFMARFTITLPFAVTQMRVLGKHQLVEVEIEKSRKKYRIDMHRARADLGLPESYTLHKYEETIKKDYDYLMAREKAHPMKALFLISVQVPLWTSFTFATNNMCIFPPPNLDAAKVLHEMMNESFLWIPDITLADPLFLLPFATGALNVFLIELHQAFKVDPNAKAEQLKVLACRLLILTLVPLGAVLPAATNIYWLSSTTFGIVQAVVLYSKPVRRFFGIPILDAQPKHPYRLLFNRFKAELPFAKKEKEEVVKREDKMMR